MKRSLLAGFTVLVTGIILFLGSCVKDTPDAPPSDTIPFDPNKVYTIQDLRNIKDTTGGYTFTDDYSVFATVTADEKSGNLYKTVFVQDSSGKGIQLNFFNPGGVYLGDYIRINLKGSKVDDYGSLYQVSNLDQGKNIYKIATGKIIEPVLVTIEELNDDLDKYQSVLVRLDSVQFQEAELGKTYADSVNKIDENRMLEDCDQISIIVRSSGYADFANHTVPEGKGSFIGISTRYNDLAQLVIRSESDLQLTAPRCGSGGGGPIDPVPSVEEYFNDAVAYSDISIEGWTNIFVQGDRKWQGKDFSGNKYAQATGYNSGLNAMECWLITPPVINTAGDKKLNFKCAMAYWEHTINEPITVLASTDFDGSNFVTANWVVLQATLPTSSSTNYTFIESGEVSLAGFVGNVAIAFKYVGSDTESTSIQIDDVTVNTGGGVTPGILSANFNSNWNDFETISVQGTQAWERNNTYGPDGSACARMSGFSGGSNANNDWLISPAVDLTDYTSINFTFETAKNYTGNDLVVKISTNYTGNPETAAWTELQATFSSGSWDWTPSGDIDLSSYAGQTIFIGFQYTSTASASATWEVDNVLIEGE